MSIKNSAAHRLTSALLAVCLIAAIFSSACAAQPPQAEQPPLSLTIAHVSDTHSYDLQYNYMTKINGINYLASMGGWGLLSSAVLDIRNHNKNVLLLHAGDLLQGTIWTPAFEGAADVDCMNTMHFDAFTPGNHEFSTGLQPFKDIVKRANFPIIAANMDVSGEPGLFGKVKPYTIVDFDGNKVGIIGLITTDTKFLGYTGNIYFFDPAETVRHYIPEMTAQGINKIIVLSHLGYEEDVKLANAVDGIDIIVGGHSHTFMGGQEFERLGLKPEMNYPSVISKPDGSKVLIVHAWEYSRMLGQIDLDFDGRGNITSYSGQPFICTSSTFSTQYDLGWYPMCHCMHEYSVIQQEITNNPGIRIYQDDAPVIFALQPYVDNITGNMQNIVAFAKENLIMGTNTGPGPVIADAFLWKARQTDADVQIALYDSYNVRSNIYKGNVTANDINMLLPLQQKLITASASGSVLKTLIEAGIDSHIKINMPPPCFELSGMRITIDMAKPSGERITSIEIKNKDGEYQALDENKVYKLVATDYLADKALAPFINRLSWLGPLAGAIEDMAKGYLNVHELGTSDVNAMTDYLKTVQTISNTTDIRTIIIQPEKDHPEQK